MAVAGQPQSFIHQLDAEVEDLRRRHQPVEAVLGMCLGSKARRDRGQPPPIVVRCNQACSVAEIVDDMGNRGRPYLTAKMLDEGTHALRCDAVGWRFEE